MNDSPIELRRQLVQQFGPVQVAWSADGGTVDWVSALDAGLTVGSFAVIDLADGISLAMQVREAHVVERDGPSLDVTDTITFVAVRSAQFRPVIRSLTGTGVVLGTFTGGEFRPIARTEPFGEFPVRATTAAETATIVAGLTSATPLTIGTLQQAPEVSATLAATGFSRHTFMCGQSGSGKTYTTGAIFERLLADTTLRLIILDPNSDHVHLGSVRDPDDHSPEAERFRAAAQGVCVARARGAGGDVLLCADFGDLPLEAQAQLLRLHPIDDGDEYTRLRTIGESFRSGPAGNAYSLDDVVHAATAAGDAVSNALARRIANLGIADWDVWRRGDEPSLTTVGLREHRCVVFDLGSLARPDERTTVALTVLGGRWLHRAERTPLLIAVDEAHNVFPAATVDPLLHATADLGSLIAGEGRKFGLHLFVATQRPLKVHPNVVSQCDNLILMRMNGAGDVHDLDTLFSHVPPAMLHASLSFRLGQALVAGPISPVPMLVQVGQRRSPEGGGDVPTTWATPEERQ